MKVHFNRIVRDINKYKSKFQLLNSKCPVATISNFMSNGSFTVLDGFLVYINFLLHIYKHDFTSLLVLRSCK